MRSIAITACLLLASTIASAQQLTVAAASDLQSALPGIALKFERETGQKVTITFGSSGNFFTQIQNGAPFDLFFSADHEYAARLEAAGLAAATLAALHTTRPHLHHGSGTHSVPAPNQAARCAGRCLGINAKLLGQIAEYPAHIILLC